MKNNNITIDGQTISFDFPVGDKDNETTKTTFICVIEHISFEKFTKFYLNENLNFLYCSSISATISGKTINKGENPFATIIEELKKTPNQRDI